MIDQLGSRFLRGLVAGQSTLLSLDQGVARLITKTGALIAATSSERLHEVITHHKSGLLHVVVVGGDENERAGLKKSFPFWQTSRQFGFHQVDDNGQYHHVKGPKLALLEQAARSAPSLDPLGPEEAGQLLEASRDLLRAENEFASKGGPPWVTISLALACVLTFVLQELWGGSRSVFGLLRMGANPGHAALSAPWTLLSSAFLHIGIEHIALNMLALISFGPLLEKALGGPRFLLLYVASALGGSLVSAIGHTALVSAGASGALWGLMVGGAVLFTRPQGALPPLLAAQGRKRVWQPVIINGIYSMQPGIDWLCHLGGGLVGGGLVASGLLLIGLRNRPSPILRSATVAAWAACVVSLGAAWAVGHPWEMGQPPPMERQFTGFAGLSLEIPKGFATQREAGAVIYGTLEHDPIAVEVRMGSSGKQMSADEMEGERVALRDLLRNKLPEGAKLIGDVREAQIAGAQGFSAETRFPNDVTARTWGWVVPDGVLVMRVYSTLNAPAGWLELPESILRSLKTSGGQVN